MKYTIVINQKLCVEQGISFKAAALLDLFSELSSWATTETFADGVYYQLAYNKILSDLPLVFQKRDTLYRFIKELKEKGLIEQCKKGKNLQNFIRLSGKGKRVLRFGNKSETQQGSDLNPTSFGNKSEARILQENHTAIEKVNQGSDLNPTYNNNTIINNIYIDFLAYQFLQNNAKEAIDIWEMQHKKNIPDYRKFLEYFEVVVESDEIEFTSKKLIARLNKLKFNWKGEFNNNNNTVDLSPIKKTVRIG